MAGFVHCGVHVVLPTSASLSHALAPLPVASAPSPILSSMNWLLFLPDRRSQHQHTPMSKLGCQISDMLWSCLASWSQPVDIKLVELISGIYAPSFMCPAFA